MGISAGAIDAGNLIPEGTYTGTIISVEEKHNENTGSFGFNVRIMVEGSEQQVNQYVYVGKNTSSTPTIQNTDVQPSKAFSLIALIRACGFTKASAPEMYVNDEWTGTPSDFVGQTIGFRVKHKEDEYNGQTTTRANLTFVPAQSVVVETTTDDRDMPF